MGQETDAERRRRRILAGVRAIPEGYVRSFGDLSPHAPRLVGRILADALEADEVPWQRVVRADGSIPCGERQRRRLRAEGVPLRGDRVDMRAARLDLPPGEHLPGA